MTVQVAHDSGVLTLTIDRPKGRNSLDDAMVETMITELEAAQNDESVRAILITSTGDDFCTGFDIVGRNENLPGTDGGGPEAGGKPRVGAIQRRLPSQSNRLVPLILNTQVPVVCAVRGWAIGLGLHVAVASDFCIAADDARFWEPFMKRGFTPDSGGTWLLPRLVGVTRAKEMLLLGRRISGVEAAEWGLIHQAVPTADVDAAVTALVDELASGPTVALGLAKWLVHTGSGLGLEQHLHNEAFAMELSSRADDFKEGIAALRDKRDPEFRGR
jgi:2-(1,2-epoxy-1,2-dihydrophenyl)acetyl-CoA isomerase